MGPGGTPRVRWFVALGLAAVVAGCGGEEAAAPDASPQATASPEEPVASHDVFCRSAVAMEEAVFRAATEGAAEPIGPLVDEVEGSVPEELEEEVTAVVSAVRRMVDQGDDTALRDPAFGASEERIDVWVGDNCDFESVTVTGVEYAFEGVPKTLPAGTTTFHFGNDGNDGNDGNELHEMLTVRITDDAISVEDLGRLSPEQAEDSIDYLGSAFARPGGTDVDTRNLVPGRYALVCFLRVGSTEAPADDDDAPTHFARGMWAEVVVK